MEGDYSLVYRIRQIATNANQIINFKSLADSERYWKYFILNEDVVRAEYINPLLLASSGYSERQIDSFDFLNCVIPIPIFSERFVEKNAVILENDIKFLPCRVSGGHGITTFYMGRVLKHDSIIDADRTGKRVLTDGTCVPDEPYIYKNTEDNFFMLRDNVYNWHYVVSERFRDLCRNFKLEFQKVRTNSL